MYKNPVCASQKTHYTSITNINRLILFRETNSGYCKYYIKYTNTFFGQNAEFTTVIRDWKTEIVEPERCRGDDHC